MEPNAIQCCILCDQDVHSAQCTMHFTVKTTASEIQKCIFVFKSLRINAFSKRYYNMESFVPLISVSVYFLVYFVGCVLTAPTNNESTENGRSWNQIISSSLDSSTFQYYVWCTLCNVHSTLWHRHLWYK